MKKILFTLFIIIAAFTAMAENNTTNLALNAEFTTVPKANLPFGMSCTFTKDGVLVEVEDIKLSFSMRMNMGNFIFTPEYSEGAYKVDKITLPRCLSGDKKWTATIEYSYEGSKERAYINFELI